MAAFLLLTGCSASALRVPALERAKAPHIASTPEPEVPVKEAQIDDPETLAVMAWQGTLPGAAKRIRDKLGARSEEGGPAPALVTRSDDGALVTFGVGIGAVIADGKTGATRGFVPWKDTLSSQFIPGTKLIVISAESNGYVVFDPDSKSELLEIPVASDPAFGRARVAWVDTDGVQVWDAVRREEIAPLPAADVSTVRFSRDGSILTISSDKHVSHDLSRGASVVATFEGNDAPVPEVSPDGRFIAIASQGFTPSGTSAGETRLFDRKAQKVLKVSTACPYPTELRFSDDGKLLGVGDLRRACVLRVPSLALVSKTQEVRPSSVDDDLQDIESMSFVDDNRSLVIRTQDGSAGLFKISNGKTTWKGTGRIVEMATRGEFVVLDLLTAALTTLSNGRETGRRELSPEEVGGTSPVTEIPPGADAQNDDARADAMVRAGTCAVGPYLLPKSAC